MQTLSFILVAVPLSFIFGITLGIMAFKSKRVEKALYQFFSNADDVSMQSWFHQWYYLDW